MATTYKVQNRLSSEARNELKDSDFGIPELREYPLIDREHLRFAEAHFRFAPVDRKHLLAQRILARAAQLGIQVHSPTVLAWARGHKTHQ
ncbi:MAG: hypothetical protein RR410_03670 [Alistipes sp.]